MIQLKDGTVTNAHFPRMSTSFDIEILSKASAPQAFPLVQATSPGIDLQSWIAFVRFFTDRALAGDGGMLAIRDGSRCICGVLAYRVHRDLRAGNVLAVHLFTAADLANSARPVEALLDAAEMWATRLGCAGIEIRLSNDQPTLATRLRDSGFSHEAGVFGKVVHSPALN